MKCVQPIPTHSVAVQLHPAQDGGSARRPPMPLPTLISPSLLGSPAPASLVVGLKALTYEVLKIGLYDKG